MKNSFQKIIIFLFVSVNLFLTVEVYSYSDSVFDRFNNNQNNELRIKKEEVLFSAISNINIYDIEDIYDPVSSVVTRFRIIRNEENIYFLFLNEDDLEFPICGKGNVVIKKDLETNTFIQMKVFLKNDPDFFIRIFPLKDRSVMDLYINNYPVVKDVLLPVSFDEVIFERISDIMAMTSLNVDWMEVLKDPQPALYSDTVIFINEIQNRLGSLGDADDGALDDNGKFVFIENLEEQKNEAAGFNCSGFVKWLSDALYYGKNNKYMKVEELKRKYEDKRGNRWSKPHEDERDPYFGLDWTRNIALKMYNDLQVKDDLSIGAVDVRNVPYFTYIDNVGYSVKQLKAILYFLAVNEPGNIYLGSFNKDFGEAPVLRQHFHVAAFLPYFDSKGKFKIAYFDRNQEKSIDYVLDIFANDFVHLVRLKMNDNFKFQNIE